MWIFLPEGFLSVVAVRGAGRGPDLLVRARVREHLTRYFPSAQVIELAGSDYRFRAFVPRGEVVALMVQQLQELDYPNFKNEVEDREYHDACLEAWSVMASLQQRTRARELRRR